MYRPRCSARPPDPPERLEFVAPVHHWTPAITPSGATFYSGDLFPGWRGNVLVGVLIAEAIIRVELADQQVANEERVELGARIRDVVQGPDGAIYALADHDPGALVRLTPGAD